MAREQETEEVRWLAVMLWAILMTRERRDGRGTYSPPGPELLGSPTLAPKAGVSAAAAAAAAVGSAVASPFVAAAAVTLSDTAMVA